MEYKLTREVAEKEFFDWAESLYIDCDTDEMNEETLDDFNSAKHKFIYALRIGRVSLNVDLDLSLQLRKPIGEIDELIFKNDFNSDVYLMLDAHKAKQNMKKMLSFIGRWTKTNPREFHKLHAVDMKFCLVITTFFLA